MNETRKRIEYETKKLILQAEIDMKRAQESVDKYTCEFDAAKRRLESAEVQMAAAIAIQEAANTHIVLQDLKEGNLEN